MAQRKQNPKRKKSFIVAKNILGFLSFLLRFLSSPRILFYTLPCLIFLIGLGTIMQKFIGLHAALQAYFYSDFFWFADIIPFPSALILMTILLINLSAQLLVKLINPLYRKRAHMGVHCVHMGVLILLIGGFFSMLWREEHVLVLPPQQAVHFIQSYDQTDLVVTDLRSKKDFIYPFHSLIAGKNITVSGQKIQIDAVMDHAIPVQLNDQKWTLKAAPLPKEPETYRQGLVLRAPETAMLFYGMDKPVSSGQFAFFLQRHQQDLPFTITLERFTKTDYQGTKMAKSYQSAIRIDDVNHQKQFTALIEMNRPLRYGGYVFYQSSFFDKMMGDHIETNSVLAVGRNPVVIFPYISCVLIAFGLLWWGC